MDTASGFHGENKMRLAAYLTGKKLSPRAFGEQRQPAVPRITIYQWAKGSRFPTDPRDLQWISDVTGGMVTAEDFVAHAVEIASAREAA